MDILENINELSNKLSSKLELINIQDNFMKSTIGQIVNSAVDIGLKTMLPDYIENEVIEVKDSLMQGGLKEGLNTAIEKTIEFGKKALGLDNTTELTSINQAKETIEKGNLISNISNNINSVLDKMLKSQEISQGTVNNIKNKEDVVLDNINANVEVEFSKEQKALEKIEKYISNWEKSYLKKDLEGLTKEYDKIQKQIKNIMPIRNIIDNINKIENIHKLIENDEKFDFNKMYLDLAEKL